MLDWRSLSQVKELGSVVEDCDEMAADLGKVFEQYWYLAGTPQLPSSWGPSYVNSFNHLHHKLFTELNSKLDSVFFFC